MHPLYSDPAEAPVHPLKVSGLCQADTWKLHPFWPHRRLAFDRTKLDRTEDKFAELVADIEEHGIREPLLVDFTYTVLDGHARLQAAQALGLPSVPVRVLWNITQRECHLISTVGPQSPQLQYMELTERLAPPGSAPPQWPEDVPAAFQQAENAEDTGIKPPTPERMPWMKRCKTLATATVRPRPYRAAQPRSGFTLQAYMGQPKHRVAGGEPFSAARRFRRPNRPARNTTVPALRPTCTDKAHGSLMTPLLKISQRCRATRVRAGMMFRPLALPGPTNARAAKPETVVG